MKNIGYSFSELKELALSFKGATEAPHFNKTSFRIKSKIFATYDFDTDLLCLKLSPELQDIYTLADKENIYPVQNKWGKHGWTLLQLSKTNKKITKEALKKAAEFLA